MDFSKAFKIESYFKKIRYMYWKAKFNQDEWLSYQKKVFHEANLNQAQGEAILKNALDSLKINALTNEISSMSSVHWLLFACLSTNQNIKRILEIGTFDGETTKLLSFLFPNAQITTVDLPENDPILKTSYGRDNPEKYRDHINLRNRNIKKSNVKFLEANSIFLLDSVSEKFDLIWVDGGHLFPEVAWDICNAYYLCEKGGILMCDDIIADSNGERNALDSSDGYLVLKYLAERINKFPHLFLKRSNPNWAAVPKYRKFVSMLIKE